MGHIAAGGRRNDFEIAAGRRNPDEITAGAATAITGRFDQIAAGLTSRYDPGSVRGPSRIAVERRRTSERHWSHGPAVDRRLHDVTGRRIAPGDVDDRLAVRRPDRLILADLGRRHPAGRAAR